MLFRCHAGSIVQYLHRKVDKIEVAGIIGATFLGLENQASGER